MLLVVIRIVPTFAEFDQGIWLGPSPYTLFVDM